MNGKKLSLIILVFFVLYFSSAFIKSYIKYRSYFSRDPHELEIFMDGSKLSQKEAEKLETKLIKDPDNFPVRIELLGYYGLNTSRTKGQEEKFQEHSIWTIENFPDTSIISTITVFNQPCDEKISNKFRELWLKQIRIYGDNAKVLGNAAYFFMISNDDTLAEKLFKKAKELEPDNPNWPEELARFYSHKGRDAPVTVRKESAQKAVEEIEEALALTDLKQDKVFLFLELSKNAYIAGDFEKASKYAKKILTSAEREYLEWEGDTTLLDWELFHYSNIILGRIALSSGKIEEAKEYLIEAGKLKGSSNPSFYRVNMMLAKELLKVGEREVVLEYFELCGSFWEDEENKLEEWAKIVRQGGIPDFDCSNLNY